jgi:hypothetical protein
MIARVPGLVGRYGLPQLLDLGDLRSRIAVNVDLPFSAIELLILAIHETYPGHHAERCSKEHLLVRGRGLVEETLVLAPTSPVERRVRELDRAQCRRRASPRRAPPHHRPRAARTAPARRSPPRPATALEPCRWAEVSAAWMLHESETSEAEVRAYLARWGLMTPQLSAHMIRFFNDPTSRAYVITYPAGRELCRSYVAGEPERFRRLLTEQVRVRDLLAAHNGGAATSPDA